MSNKGDQKSSTAVNYLNLFGSISFQDFSKHIRNEPCGICVKSIAERAEGFHEESEYKAILNTFGEGNPINQLPKVANYIIKLSINHLNFLATEKSPNEAMEFNICILEILVKIYNYAHMDAVRITKSYNSSKNGILAKGFYSYYRKLCPILNQEDFYFAVFNKHKRILDSQSATGFYKNVIDEKKDIDILLNAINIPNTPYLVQKNGKQVTLNNRKRRVWGSAYEMSDIYNKDTNIGDKISFGIITFNSDHLFVFSEDNIHTDETYTGDININCVDLPFNMEVTLDKKTTRYISDGIKNKRESQKDLVKLQSELQNGKKYNNLNFFILKINKIDENHKNYFKSACLEQIELERNLGAKFYKEAFCNN
jgi:hypothetical protein